MTDGQVWVVTRSAPEFEEFRRELAQLLNRHSMDSFTATPDHILAEWVANQLVDFRHVRLVTAAWEGRPIRYLPVPKEGKTSSDPPGTP